MKKIVAVKPFGVYKITDEVLRSVEENTDTHTGLHEAVQEYVKSIKSGGSGKFVGINPDRKELFTFIPIINGDQFFVSIFPDPIHLYFSSAYSYFEHAEHTRNNIVFQDRQLGPMNWISDYLYNWHLTYKISCVVFLHLTVEAFINYSMPEDFVYKQVVENDKSKKFNKQTNEYDKEGVERHIQFKEKLFLVLPQFSGIDLQKDHQKIYDKLINLNDLRNDVIHLRSLKNEKNLHHFHAVFDRVINIELFPFVEAVMDFLNLVTPDFISLVDAGEKKYSGNAVFEFEHYKAFKLDITIFLKILEVNAELITINMPITDDGDYLLFKNWAMQNLDVMAKEQWIYFPEIIENEDRLTIKIIKNMNKISSLKIEELVKKKRTRKKA